VIPGIGIASELISVFSRKKLSGYKALALGSVMVALLSFLAWGHHLFGSGQSMVVSVISSALTLAIAIPVAIMIYSWLATLRKGSITLETPMLYGLMFVVSFGIAALTGLPLALGGTGAFLSGTQFAMAHLHYFVFGGVVIAMLGGLHYWWPKITGRMYDEFTGQASCCFVFVGFNVTFFGQLLLGAQGAVGRSWQYQPEFQSLHQLSTAGSIVLALGLIVSGFNLLRSLGREGLRAPNNPWGAATLEWQGASPPRHDNFEAAPAVGDPYDFSGLSYDPTNGGWSAV
jgi:cytochrome c oxidase subunit 1